MSKKQAGAEMHSDDAEARKQAAALLGSARTEAKIAAARSVAESRKGATLTPEQKERQRQGQLARWERIRQERAAFGLVEEPKEKRKAGRPRTKPEEDANTPKRPRGRPKKQESAE